jgi:superfamily I DNA and/or RNA helicase
MVDECSQMWLGEILPILHQNHNLKRLVLVGDHQQLPPYGSQQMKEANLPGKSLFEIVLDTKYVTRGFVLI